jgi:GNAT superfamily N-acetyltransferase
MMNVRPVKDDELSTVAAIHVRSWQTAYGGIVPDKYLAAQDVTKGEAKWRRTSRKYPGNLRVAVDNQEDVLGFCYLALVGDEPEDQPYDGRLYALHVRSDLKRNGIGSQLLTSAFDRLRTMGCRSVIVWTFDDLAPSRRFYEHLGGTLVKSKRSDFGGKKIVEVAYGWEDLADRT